MNKQKTLIFSLLSFFLIAISFVVYSAPWTEPTTMPSSYNPPINTSSTAQTKLGEIGATVFRDADNSNYYMNPSGNSIISGKIVTEADIVDSDPFGTIPTKGYLDQRLSEFAQDTKFSYSNVFYIQGALGAPVTCPDGTIEIMRHWLAKGCAGTSSYPCTKQSICETFSGWADKYNPEVAFSCSYYNYNASCGIVNTGNCVADINNNSDAVLCMFNNAPENVLFGLKHSIDDCENAGGAVETVEGNVKLCKFPDSQLTGNCRNFSCAWCSGDSCQDSCVCPAGWNAYKNWMTTSQQYIKSWLIAPGHDWANEGRASVSDVDCYGWLANVDYKGCY